MVFPVQLIQLFSLDTQVVQLGASFITILAVSYFFTGVTILLTVILRSMGEVKRPMYISIFAIAFNTLLNYLFIFGNWGFPEMGIEGAAIATVIARTIQCVFMLILIMQFDLLGSLKGLQLTEVFDWPTVKNYFTISIPSILNHIFWTLGETSYFWVYARMGTDQLAAVTLIDPLMLLSMALFIGLGDASSVMVGNSIGAKEKDQAYDFAKRFLKITVILSIAVGLAIVSIAPIFVGFYNIPPIAADYAKSILLVYALIVPFRMLNMVNNIGVLRPGGDTRFVMYLDLLGVWLVGLPLALLGAYLQLPIYIVFLLANTQEVARVIFGLRRTVSKKWMNDVISKNETFKDDLQKSV
ncbi:probable cation efflux pump [Halalkalibacter wakoensis JCM 9140]|uniref:Probable cation efflux pump n=1 Tax=Halalkalibacter wakoensis JCM 9140 TaxID=1236970 RepID=W4PY20_9BACI|nr:probable cation efflux pump [Halalkalibacter wakoensis JCM 9140]